MSNANDVREPFIFAGTYLKDRQTDFQKYMTQKHSVVAKDLISILNIKPEQQVLDFGAGTGGLVRAFLENGHTNIVGTDPSHYAVQYGQRVLNLEDRMRFFSMELLNQASQYIIALDLLERVPTTGELSNILRLARNNLEGGMAVRVPISSVEGENYVLDVSRNDKTKVQCHTRDWWIDFMAKSGYSLDSEINGKGIHCSEGVFAGFFKPQNGLDRSEAGTESDLVFERGYFQSSQVSNYANYMEKRHDQLADDLIKNLSMSTDDVVVDYGAATGNLIREFRDRGFSKAAGTDLSYFAVEYGKNVLGLGDHIQFYNLDLLAKPKDHVIILDVLEHVPTEDELNKILSLSAQGLRKNLIVRIPVAEHEGENYFLPVSRNDKTHIQCHSKDWWDELFQENGLALSQKLNLPSIYDSTGVYSAVYQRK